MRYLSLVSRSELFAFDPLSIASRALKLLWKLHQCWQWKCLALWCIFYPNATEQKALWLQQFTAVWVRAVYGERRMVNGQGGLYVKTQDCQGSFCFNPWFLDPFLQTLHPIILYFSSHTRLMYTRGLIRVYRIRKIYEWLKQKIRQKNKRLGLIRFPAVRQERDDWAGWPRLWQIVCPASKNDQPAAWWRSCRDSCQCQSADDSCGSCHSLMEEPRLALVPPPTIIALSATARQQTKSRLAEAEAVSLCVPPPRFQLSGLGPSISTLNFETIILSEPNISFDLCILNSFDRPWEYSD